MTSFLLYLLICIPTLCVAIVTISLLIKNFKKYNETGDLLDNTNNYESVKETSSYNILKHFIEIYRIIKSELIEFLRIFKNIFPFAKKVSSEIALYNLSQNTTEKRINKLIKMRLDIFALKAEEVANKSLLEYTDKINKENNEKIAIMENTLNELMGEKGVNG